MTCVAGHQPNLYPYGGFFSKAMNVDVFVIVDNTQYVKKQYQNRNRIRLLNGEVQWISLPVKNSGRFKQLIMDVEIDNSVNWRDKHKKSLLFNYRKAQFFDEYYPALEELISRDWAKLTDFNTAFIAHCFTLLDINIPVKKASDLGVEGQATSLILDICRKTGSESYLHGFHSRDYVDFSLLENEGIRNMIQDFNCEEYAQTSPGFEANLSILDILFNCGPDAKTLLESSTTVSSVER